jgi:AcrR family transcriptional regulator
VARAPAAAWEEILPEGADPPPDVPADIFEAALSVFLAGRRLDMRALAVDLGIGRATLYRRVDNRDRLLGEIIWYLTRRALLPALERAEGKTGPARVLAVVEDFMRFVHAQEPFRRFLDAEPEIALRILTSKHGVVQRRLIEAQERLLAQEQERGNLNPSMDLATLAYVIVRIGESFLYADVIADSETDIGQAVEVIGRLLAESA